MELKTKFSIGQTVTVIYQKRVQIPLVCSFCENKPLFLVSEGVVKDTLAICPQCYDRPGVKHEYDEWEYNTSGRIGKIEIAATLPRDEDNDIDWVGVIEVETRYMIDTTGIGTGTLWPEDVLLDDDEDWHEECDRRNQKAGVGEYFSEVKSGWAKPARALRRHYFDNSRISLCNAHHGYGGALSVNEPNNAYDPCIRCLRLARKEGLIS